MKNIEVEGGEIAIKNKAGDLVIIPKSKASWVKQKLKEGCHSCIDALVETLPVMEDYAQDGSIYPTDTKGNPTRKETFTQWGERVRKLAPNLDYTKDNGIYNYRGAYEAGLEPEWVEEDKSYHLGSRNPITGEILKSEKHPSFKQSVDADMKIGYETYRGIDGKIYSHDRAYLDKNKDKVKEYLGTYSGGTLPEVEVTAEAPEWVKDKKTKKLDKINWYESLNYKKWGLNDYSDYSSFNSAFRNSRENKEREFVYKGKRYNTDLISKEQSDLYWESKKFLEDYYTNQDYKPFKNKLPYNIKDLYIKEKFGKTWSEYYNEIKDSDDYQVNSKNFDKTQAELDKLDSYDESKFKNNKDYDLFIENYLKKEEQKQRDIELNNLKEPYYFSITDKKPKNMSEDGYLDSKNKKMFLTTNAEKNKLNTTYIHELSHKADNYEVYKRVPEIDINLINKDEYFKKTYSPEMFNYLSDPSEIEARKFSTLFYLYKNKKAHTNISKEQLNDLYKEKNNSLPYDIRQLLDLYANQKEDLLKYLNNDFQYKQNKSEQ